jgi:mannose-1-phosphate guanylyltransferase
MIVVIIACGSGTRLWPLSTHDYPKHLLKLINQRSLLQNTYDRVSSLAKDEDIFIVPEVSHVEHVYDQLPNVPKNNILFEPARRGTASCFILALSTIKQRNYEDQPVFFLWADHLIRDRRGFDSSVRMATELADKEKKLVFMGIEPTYASTGLGYMEKGDQLSNGFKHAFELKQFVEKPDYKTAEHYLQSGDYLWNTGYLVGNIKTFEREIKANAPELWADYQKLSTTDDVAKTYLAFKSQPIDTALSEHVKDGLVVPGSFDWLDIGSFHDLHGASPQDESGNHLVGDKIEAEHVSNSYIRNEQALPVVVIGLDNIAVIATDNGFLVTSKTRAQNVGEIAKRLQENDK